jgi:hypothetical protein
MSKPTAILTRLGGFEQVQLLTPIPYSAFAEPDARRAETLPMDLPEGDGIWHRIDGKWVEVET